MWKRGWIVLIFLALFVVACAQPRASAPLEPGIFESRGGPVLGAPDTVEQKAFVEDEAARSLPLAGETDFAPAPQERVVIQTAEMSIAVADPAQTMDAIIAMAEGMGGFVVNSNLFYTQLDSGAEVPQARVMVRIPAERLTEAMEQIEMGAGRVLTKNISGQDVTREYTDLQSRLRNLEEAESRLREIMGSATKTQDVLEVHRELTRIREQIEVIQGQIQYFEQSAAFSALSVEILADEAVQPLTIGRWEPGGVVKDALQALINALKWIANAFIWTVLFVLPVLLVVFSPLYVIWRGIKRWRARRREQQPPAES